MQNGIYFCKTESTFGKSTQTRVQVDSKVDVGPEFTGLFVLQQFARQVIICLHHAESHEGHEAVEEGQEDSSGAEASSCLRRCRSSSATGAGDEGT